MTLERLGFRLTAEAENDAADFEREYGSINGCRCHLCPPCSYCTHPGNPANLEEDDLAWEPDPEEIKQPIKVRIEGASSRAKLSMLIAAAMAGLPTAYPIEITPGYYEDRDEPCQLGRPRRVYQRQPKEPNPEIQTAAEAKRQRRLERNRRIAK